MKKIICFLISIIMFFSLTAAAFASDTLASVNYTYQPEVNGKSCSMINNEYYRIYYNDIFEHEYANLSRYSLSGMTETFLAAVSNDEYTYATVIMAEKSDETSYTEYNKAILSNILKEEDLLYIGDTTPLSVVRLTKADADKLTAAEQVKGIFPAFFAANILTNAMLGEETIGDVTGGAEVTSADARFLLRFSAGLESVDRNNAKQFYFCGDMNFDGTITSADARLALRTAANLEETLTITFGSVDTWNDFR